MAVGLAQQRKLDAYVRPYANKSRLWERAVCVLPGVGATYHSTFGRRLLDPALRPLTHEAGVVPDLLAAAIGRFKVLPSRLRHRWTNQLYMSVREAVAHSACRHVDVVQCVVAYEGFALPSFQVARHLGQRSLVLNYPVSHHRHRRAARLAENEREPQFATTWPDFDDWAPGHEERLDAEIDAADVVLVGSTYARDSFVEEGIPADKLKIVPYGVDLQTFAPGPPRARGPLFKVIYAGQLTQRKGIAYLLRAYKKFARADTQLTMVGSVVGEPTPLTPFAGDFVHVPHQTRPALAQRYRDSDVFVFPTLVEGMGLVVLEAMACGLPVIVTANGPGDLVRDGIDGYVIPDRDEDAICDRLERLYRDPALCAEMGREAAQRARLFDWGNYTRMTHEVLIGLHHRS